MKAEGHVALVTGAARRVGRAIALELARCGCDVAVHYNRSAEDAEIVAEEIRRLGRRAATFAAELNRPETWPGTVERAVQSLGRLDVLVNNASVFQTDQPDTIEEFDAGLWERMFRVNLLAPMGLAHAAREHLAATGAGKIVNLGDAAVDRPWPTHLAYGASKAALTAMTKSLARALAPHVQVNAVAPGIAVFPESYSQELRRKLVSRVPLQREGTPEEVARVVRFLVEEGDYITGQVIPIDGGRSAV